MSGGETDSQQEERLALRSRLSDIARIPPWIARLAALHTIPPDVEFAINLCLEEAVSNVIRHGYGEDADGSVTVLFALARPDVFVFTVEDEARGFNPLASGAVNAEGTVRVGGQGINFLRQFANELEYEMTATGNRLRIGFSGGASAI